MTKKLIKNYVKNLQSLRDARRGKVSNQTLTKINNVVDLYEDRKISQFTTALNLINGMTMGSEKSKQKGLKQYEKAVAKYETAEPITERMKNTPAKAREVKKEKEAERGKQQVLRRIRQKMAVRKISNKASEKVFGNKKQYMVSYMLFSVEPRISKKVAFKVNGVSFYPLLTNPAVRTANIKSNDFIEGLVKRKITTMWDKYLFKKVMMVMGTDENFRSQMQSLEYVDAIRIEKVEEVDEKDEHKTPTARNLRNAQNISIYNRYVETEINTDYMTVKEAIAKENYRENECWINALTDHYEETLMRQKRGSLAKPALTRERVLEMLGMTEEGFVEKGASIMQMEHIFKEYNIPARIFDFNCNLIYKHDPTKSINNVRTFNGLVKGNHIYVINNDLKNLKDVMHKTHDMQVKVSDNYHIDDRKKPIKCKMIDNINDLLKLTDEEDYTLIHRDNDLPKLLHDFKQSGYEPFVKYQAGTISELKVRWRYKKLNKTINYTIKSQNMNNNKIDEDVVVSSERVHNRTSKAMFAMNKKIFNEAHKSHYNEVDVQVLDECRTVVPTGLLCKNEGEKLTEIDLNKAFTKAFTNIVKIPVFRQFDIWKPYKNEDINTLPSLTLFMVENAGSNMYFNKKHNLIYGKYLKQIMARGIKPKILYFKQPSHIHKVDYKKIVDDLWETNISKDEHQNKQIKKIIANINFGLLEKSRNKAQRSRMFETLDEAMYYQKLYGGRVYAIDEAQDDYTYTPLTDEIKGSITEWDFEDDFFMTGDGVLERFAVVNGQIHIQEDCRKYVSKYYILNVSDERTLSNGFRMIKELLLQDHNYRMFDAHNRLTGNGINVYSVKADAMTIKTSDLDKAREILKFGTVIGEWRAEQNKVIRLPEQNRKIMFNQLINIPKQVNEKIHIKDEWDTPEICQQIIEHNPVMIRARFAGSGKSYICEYFKKLGYNVLFVVPTNQLSQEKECDAITLNKFFSIPMEKGEELPIFDHSEYHVICFDEVYMANAYILNKIRLFTKQNTNKIIIATGDDKQLPPIEDLTNCQNKEAYGNQCLDIIFKYNIYLEICKRVKDEENRTIINNMFDDWWVKQLPLKELVRKYFKTTADVMASTYNIAYTNKRCADVSKTVRQRLGKTTDYEIGEVLVCRFYKKIGSKRLNVNFRYKIKGVNKGNYLLENIKSLEQCTVDRETIEKHFRYNYCITCHSAQGATIKDTITIHEWQSPLVSREWLWCSITRCDDFNKVLFFESSAFEKDMDKKMIMDYFENKMEGYKQQDRQKDREINDDMYIDTMWCLKRMKGNCQKCGVKFEFITKKGKLCSNFTAQRVCNLRAHHIDNCQAWCKY